MKRSAWMTSLAVVAAAGALAAAPAATAQDAESRLRLLEKTLEDLLQRDAEKDELIHTLQRRVEDLNAGKRMPVSEDGGGSGHGDADGHGHAHEAEPGGAHAGHDHAAGGELPDLYAVDVSGGTLRFKGISVDTAVAAGYSSEDGETLEALQGGGHDPRQNGLTVQSVDIGLFGAFDPYFDARAKLAILLDTEGETQVELEEAFLQSKSLPAGLQLRAGHFFTEFGRFNPQHVHDWDWVDQPVINSRLFGEDGARAPGVRALWQAPTRTRVYLGMQNAHGETMASFLSSDEAFEERPVGGRAFGEREVDDFGEFVYYARLEQPADLDPATWMVAGLSGMLGPNATGPDGRTVIYGADLTLDHDLGSGRFLRWQSEVMGRRYEADADPGNGFADDRLYDYGLYTQLLYGFAPGWAAGLRYEYAGGSGASLGDFASRDEDPFRADRQRVSPLLVWQFAPTAKLRLQYNYDHADSLNGDAHAVWVGLLWSFGAGGHDH